jgi:hypothetical protein
MKTLNFLFLSFFIISSFTSSKLRKILLNKDNTNTNPVNGNSITSQTEQDEDTTQLYLENFKGARRAADNTDFLKNTFNFYDEDNDGKLNINEVGLLLTAVAARSGMPLPNQENINRFFDEADSKGSGKINYQQFVGEMKTALDRIIDQYTSYLNNLNSNNKNAVPSNNNSSNLNYSKGNQIDSKSTNSVKNIQQNHSTENHGESKTINSNKTKNSTIRPNENSSNQKYF